MRKRGEGGGEIEGEWEREKIDTIKQRSVSLFFIRKYKMFTVIPYDIKVYYYYYYYYY